MATEWACDHGKPPDASDFQLKQRLAYQSKPKKILPLTPHQFR